ncbi:MAG: hypothetical protein GQ470_04270, partial [Gammaproteobacteria bacterium]|nr:hypothetical protein [Gammaproteobacteria bacterium]
QILAYLITVLSEEDATFDSEHVVSSLSISSNSGSVEFNNTGNLILGATSATESLIINSQGDIEQTGDLASDSGDITLLSVDGSITMADGIKTVTSGGSISYMATDNIVLSLLDADFTGDGSQGSIVVNSEVGNILSNDVREPSVRANTVLLDAGKSLGENSLYPFILSSDIQGDVTIDYSQEAYIATGPVQDANLSIIDLGTGVVDTGAARSAGTQRGQTSGLTDIGYIDSSLFSDVNFFVVNGEGIVLPPELREIAPELSDESFNGVGENQEQVEKERSKHRLTIIEEQSKDEIPTQENVEKRTDFK